MSRSVTLTIGCILVACVASSGFDALQTQMAISGSHLAGANFQLMLLLPKNLGKTLDNLHLSQLDISEGAHVVDAVAAFTEEYRRQGGSIKNLDVVVKQPEALSFVRERGLSFYTKSMTDVVFLYLASSEIRKKG